MKKVWTLSMILILISTVSCIFEQSENNTIIHNREFITFKEDLDFLKGHTEIILLRESGANGMLAISPALQGRVMTSTSQGLMGRSYGWINRPLFSSGDTLKHINAYGGEERFWLGPEGGQYSIFFKQGASFDLDSWQTPKLIDSDPFNLVHQEKRKAIFRKRGRLTNYSNFIFEIEIERSIELLSSEESCTVLGIASNDEFSVVGYKSTNSMTNIGEQDWLKESGLLSIWLLGMFQPSDETIVVIPYIEGEDQKLGRIVNDNYFGQVPPDRLQLKNGVVFFKGDGKFRSKIGLNARRAIFILGAYDYENQVLTIIKYNKPIEQTEYVNSLWEIQNQPYDGDVINSYNDGAPAPGEDPLGPFYELETSSPALQLKKGEVGRHIQYTFHFEGDEVVLNALTFELLGVSIDEIKKVFN